MGITSKALPHVNDEGTQLTHSFYVDPESPSRTAIDVSAYTTMGFAYRETDGTEGTIVADAGSETNEIVATVPAGFWTGQTVVTLRAYVGDGAGVELHSDNIAVRVRQEWE